VAFRARLLFTEKASIDEAFIDLTAPVRETILQRYPHLTQVPDTGMDTLLPAPQPLDFRGIGTLIPIDPDQEEAAETVTMDSPTWHDVALSIGAELMQKLRDDIRTKLGYTLSAVRTQL
jgi:DNA polymerase eta